MFALKPTCVARKAVPARAVAVNAGKKASVDVSAPALLKPAVTVAVANAVMAMPAEAAGKLFDFNLTLPIMAGQFLLLMVFLDKSWFTPVGKVLDERDELIRDKLTNVQSDTGEISELQEKAEAVLKDARQEAAKVVKEALTSTQVEQDAKVAKVKAEVTKELEVAMAALQEEQKAAEDSVDEQAEALVEDILNRVIPTMESIDAEIAAISKANAEADAAAKLAEEEAAKKPSALLSLLPDV